MPFVCLPFIFWSFDLFVASLLFMKGISYCVIRRKSHTNPYNSMPYCVPCVVHKDSLSYMWKDEVLKQADFASEWRKSRFRGLKISQFSGGRMPSNPLSLKPGSAPEVWEKYNKIRIRSRRNKFDDFIKGFFSAHTDYRIPGSRDQHVALSPS